jgi:FAD dependent oxidoreductase
MTVPGNVTGTVVVCGAGAAGIAAALAAARAGADVCLVEARPQLGGTVTHSLIHTLAGLYDSAGELLNSGLVRDLAFTLVKSNATTCKRRLGRAYVLGVDPDIYQTVVEQWIRQEPRITVLRNTMVGGAFRAEDRLEGLDVKTPDGATRLRVKAVVDATGSGTVVGLADPALLHDSHKRAAGGLIFSMRGVAPDAVRFPRGLAILRALRESAADGLMPPDCGKTWIDNGVHDGEIYVKLFVPLPDDWHERESRGEITRTALRTQSAVVSFLAKRPEFAGATVFRTGTLGIRDGGRVCGEYCLTAEDVRKGRKFEDAACRCCWPIEFWDPREGVLLEYLPEGSWYDIPLRALKVKGFSNFWVAGKCLSADPLAQASARCVGTCWSMGEAVGKAAAQL